MDERNEEFLEALTEIDDERVKNIIVSYATEIRKAAAEEILKVIEEKINFVKEQQKTLIIKGLLSTLWIDSALEILMELREEIKKKFGVD